MELDKHISTEYTARFSPFDAVPKRPLWSVIIPTRNCAVYLRDTLLSVLCQYPGNDKMEIIVVDDCSNKDSPFEVVEKYGNGKVQFIKQSSNVGKSRNYATGIKMSKGKYIHILHGDDIVLPGFYSEMEMIFLNFPEAGAAFCRANYINQDGEIKGKTGVERSEMGILENWLDKIVLSQRIQPPSLVVKREVYEQIGGYDIRLKYMEDWEMYVRIATKFSFAFTPKLLASYRVHSNNSSQSSILKGERLKTHRLIIKIIDSYVCIDKETRKSRNNFQAEYLISFYPNK